MPLTPTNRKFLALDLYSEYLMCSWAVCICVLCMCIYYLKKMVRSPFCTFGEVVLSIFGT